MLAFDSYREATMKGLTGPGNGGFPSGIDDLWVLATYAGPHSLDYERWELRQRSRKRSSQSSNRGCAWKGQEVPCHPRRRVDEIVATQSRQCAKIRQFRLSPLERKPLQRLT